MKKLTTIILPVLLITLTVACNKKDENDDTVSVHGANHTLAELATDLNGITTLCQTSGLAKIGTYATTTPHSWKQSYSIDNAGNFQFTTSVYDDGTCTSAAYEITQIGTIAVIGASTKVANGTNVSFTLVQTQYSPSDETWRTQINAACNGSDVGAVGNVAEWSGRGCQVGGSFNLITFPSVGDVLLNTFVLDTTNHTMKIYRDTTTHVGFYSFGKTSYPTSATHSFDTY